MVCPHCHENTKVTNSRTHKNGFSVWRRRHCQSCQSTFTTLEQISIESTIAFKTADGSLKPLNRQRIYISVLNALGGSKTVSETAEQLTLTCINKILNEKTDRLKQQTVEKHIFETLEAYESLAGQRYLLNELKQTKLKPEESLAD